MTTNGTEYPTWVLEAIEHLNTLISSNSGLEHCARCDASHANLAWNRITRIVPNGPVPSAIVGWAMCPALNEPIFLEVWEDTTP